MMVNLYSQYRKIRPALLGVWSKKRFMLWSFCVINVAGWSAVSLLPNQYESTAKVFADTKSLLRPLLQGIAVQGDTDEEVRVMAQNLLSKPNLEAIARQSGLYLKYATPESYEVFLMNFQKEIQIEGSKRQSLFEISYTHENPKVAKNVVELTLQKFVDATVGQSRADNDTATVFLTGQIQEQKSKLEHAEKALADFKQKYQQLLPQRGSSYMQDVNLLRQQLEDISLSLNEKEAQLLSLQQSVKGDNGSAGFAPGLPSDLRSFQVKTPLDEKIAQLESALVTLRIKYTEQHPDIVEMNQMLNELKPEQKRLQKALLETAAQGQLISSSGEDSGSLQDASMVVMQLRSEVGSLEAKKNLIQARLVERESVLDGIPDVEAKLTALNRDYDTTKELYLSLLKRRDSAELSRSMNENTNEVKFRVIEPPSEPLIAKGPMRSLFYVIVFLFACVFSVGFAFLLSQFGSTVRGLEHLTMLTGRPAIASIPNLTLPKTKKTLSNLLSLMIFLFFAAVLVALVAHELSTGHSPVLWLRKEVI